MTSKPHAKANAVKPQVHTLRVQLTDRSGRLTTAQVQSYIYDALEHLSIIDQDPIEHAWEKRNPLFAHFWVIPINRKAKP
jgi:hypothetical protein